MKNSNVDVKVSFNRVDKSEALKQFIKRKSSKLKKFFKKPVEMDWVILLHNNVFEPHLKIVHNGNMFSLAAQSADPFKAVNKVAHKAKNMASRIHGRRVSLH